MEKKRFYFNKRFILLSIIIVIAILNFSILSYSVLAGEGPGGGSGEEIGFGAGEAALPSEAVGLAPIQEGGAPSSQTETGGSSPSSTSQPPTSSQPMGEVQSCTYECNSGTIQSRTCGLGGTQTRRCFGCNSLGWGMWGTWTNCQGETGVCSPGQIQSRTCGQGICSNGKETRKCENNYQWGSWSSCSTNNLIREECCSLNNQDENCNGIVNEYCDKDGDGFIDGNAKICPNEDVETFSTLTELSSLNLVKKIRRLLGINVER